MGKPLDHQEMVRKALHSIYHMHKRWHDDNRGTPFWAVIAKYFGVGSTTAGQLCAEFGYDPDTQMNHYPRSRC